MPEEDGYSLMRSLRGAGIATPAIALTAYARHEDADEARAAGFQIHLSKPIDAAARGRGRHTAMKSRPRPLIRLPLLCHCLVGPRDESMNR